jgi:modulator of FtsH protease
MNNSITSDNITSKNHILGQVYKLLGANMLTSSIFVIIGTALNLSHLTGLILMISAFILLFVIGKKANSSTGVWLTFIFTGLLGLSMSPNLNYYLNLSNGTEIIFQALASTSIIFLSLSYYVITNPKSDFSKLNSFLYIGLVTVIVAMLSNIFLQLPLLSIVLSGSVALIMSGFIVVETSKIINTQPNYVLASVSLYLNIFNLFNSLMHIIGFTKSE